MLTANWLLATGSWVGGRKRIIPAELARASLQALPAILMPPMWSRQSVDAEACAEMITGAEHVVALTGAGISTAAGIPDFRGPQGLYVTRQYDPETVFEIGAFRRDPTPFYEFTRDFLGVIHTIQPTSTHRFLADLEARGRLAAVVTQNIDSLHQKAGSKNVISVHGDYWTSHCLACNQEFELGRMEKMVVEVAVPRCECGGVIKPDVVFFGEAVHDLEFAASAVAASDLLLVLGSTLVIYPAAFLPEQAGGDVVVVNRGEVGLAPGPGRYFVDADLDEYFGEVARFLEQ
jgi:NAD-dependent deacetylase